MGDALTSSNPDAVALYDESGNRVTLVGGSAANGQVPVKFHSTASATTSVTPTSAGSTTVLASNATRKGATIFNESGSTAYIALGTIATTTAYTVQIAVGGYYEAPYGYTGIITGTTASGSAVLRLTEFT